LINYFKILLKSSITNTFSTDKIECRLTSDTNTRIACGACKRAKVTVRRTGIIVSRCTTKALDGRYVTVGAGRD
jgi:hypothetical protein